MYNPPKFLTKKLLLEVLSEFDWTESYKIQDEDITVDGIKVRFPKCELYFCEGFESDMDVYLLDSSSKENDYKALFDLVYYVYRPKIESDSSFVSPKLNEYFSPCASLEKVKFELRDICILLQCYLMPCIKGDFTLLNEYKGNFGII
jgi:hypothetical protein